MWKDKTKRWRQVFIESVWFGIIVVLGGVVSGWFLFANDHDGYYLNSYTEVFVGIFATFFIVRAIEKRISDRQEQKLKQGLEAAERKRKLKELPLRAASRAHSIAIAAVEELCQQGWHVYVEEIQKGLLEGRDLHKANLEGAVLANARLCKATLTDAILINAEINRADLSEATLIGTKFQDAELEGAKLRGIIVSEKTHFNDAKLTGANFGMGKIRGVVVLGSGLKPFTTRKDISIPFTTPKIRRRTNIANIGFSKAILNHAKMRFVEASNTHFENAELAGADLTKAHLHGAKMQYAKLNTTATKPTLLIRADFTGATLTNIQAIGADFTRAILIGADLQEAVLLQATLIDADLREAHFEGAKLTGAKLLGAKGIESAHFNTETILPDGTPWDIDTDMKKYTEVPIVPKRPVSSPRPRPLGIPLDTEDDE